MTHAEKLARIEQLIASPDVIELNALVEEVDAFEKATFPIPAPTLSEAMKFRRQQTGETQKDIAARAGISLGRWKSLELGHVPSGPEVRKLYAIGIPADVLLGDANSQP